MSVMPVPSRTDTRITLAAEPQLLDNFSALMESIMRAKPQAAKGVYVKTVYLSGTMGPSVRVDPAAASRLTAA